LGRPGIERIQVDADEQGLEAQGHGAEVRAKSAREDGGFAVAWDRRRVLGVWRSSHALTLFTLR
jgi:hypothetical protein